MRLLVAPLSLLTVVCLCNGLNKLGSQRSCQLPSSWLGTWFESGFSDSVEITLTGLTHKGECLHRGKGGQVLLRDSLEGISCVRCLYIHQKHQNVIQYKESRCISHPVSSLKSICRMIEVDDPLKTLFRMSADPTPCPISGSMSFAYQLGPQRTCGSPLSSLNQCEKDSMLLLEYRACPDLRGSQSLVQQLECVAQWKEGSVHYFAGRMNTSLVTRPGDWESIFRCFVYRRQHNGWLLAQSGEAKCNLHRATEGHRTLNLQQLSSHCKFPPWLKSDKSLLSKDLNLSLTVTHDAANLTISVGERTVNMKCVTNSEDGDEAFKAVFETKTDCDIQYQCVAIKKIKEGASVRLGERTKYKEDACRMQLGSESFLRSSHPLPQCSLNIPAPPGSCSPLALATASVATNPSTSFWTIILLPTAPFMWKLAFG